MAFASDALKYMQHHATGGRNPNLRSAVNSGLVGVTTNPNNNSYHHSKNSSPFKAVGAYTNRWWNDLARNHPSINKDAVTGSDRSMSRADMIKSWKLHKAVFDDHDDPRRKYFAEYIGTPDGVTALRLDFADGSVDSANKSHTWHEHEGWWYLYWGSWDAADASLSIKRGETKAQYRARHRQVIPPVVVEPAEEEDEMKPFLGNVKGKATVWYGLRAGAQSVSLMALTKPNAVDALVASGAIRREFDSPQALVEACGTLPGDGTGELSLDAVTKAG